MRKLTPAEVDQNFTNLRVTADLALAYIINFMSGASLSTLSKNSPSSWGLVIDNTGGTSPYGLQVAYSNVGDGSGGDFIAGRDLTTWRFRIFGNGNMTNVNNSYGASSDLKLKENIETARGYLEDLSRVRIVRYSLKSDASATATHLGVIAQELEDIFPGLVEDNRDTAEREVEIDGKFVMERYETGQVTKSVKYSVFVPMLIKAVQELKLRVEMLEGQLSEVRQ
jgi:hypothetical protein